MSKNEDRILILGYHGQVATALRQRLPDGRFLSSRDLDLRFPERIPSILSGLKPKVIVNAAAYTAVDQAEDEPQVATLINETAVEAIAHWCAKNVAHLIHYSTDYVFNGEKSEAYVEGDLKEPMNYYGLTKSRGEDAIVRSGCSYQILRVSWVYSPWGKNFVKTMLSLGQNKEKLRIVADQRGMPTSAADIAGVTMRLIESPEQIGIFHFCGEGATNWHEFATEIFTIARSFGVPLAIKDIDPIETKEYPTKAVRPKNSMLSCEKIFQEFGIICPPWRQSLRSVIQQLAKDMI